MRKKKPDKDPPAVARASFYFFSIYMYIYIYNYMRKKKYIASFAPTAFIGKRRASLSRSSAAKAPLTLRVTGHASRCGAEGAKAKESQTKFGC